MVTNVIVIIVIIIIIVVVVVIIIALSSWYFKKLPSYNQFHTTKEMSKFIGYNFYFYFISERLYIISNIHTFLSPIFTF